MDEIYGCQARAPGFRLKGDFGPSKETLALGTKLFFLVWLKCFFYEILSISLYLFCMSCYLAYFFHIKLYLCGKYDYSSDMCLLMTLHDYLMDAFFCYSLDV